MLSFIAYQRPHDLAPTRWRQAPAPALGQGIDQHEAAAALVTEARLDRRGRPGVLIPDLNERRLSVRREPEVDLG